MREMVLRGRTRLLVSGILLILSGGVPVHGDDSAAVNPVRIAAGDEAGFDIQGTVTDAPDFAGFFARLGAAPEKAQLKSEQDFESALMDAWKGIDDPGPAANVVVILIGPSTTKKTRTDAEGNFSFANVSAGEYLVSAEAPTRPTPVKGVTRTATASEEITIGRYTGKVRLELSTIRPVIRGRITDPDGIPIPGAKVTAILDVHHVVFESWLETHDTPAWSTVSNEDGSYELEGMDSMNWYHLAGALAGGKALREFVDIQVEADGYRQTEENTPEVPLATEDVIILARRLLGIFNQWARENGTEEHPEKEGLPLPASEGNMITGIDIVLEPVGAGTGDGGEKGSGVETGRAAPPAFVEIRIGSYPQGRGRAYKTVRFDGSITGGHLSGGSSAPRVHRSQSEVTTDDLDTLKNLATALELRSLPAVARPDQKSQGYKSVTVVTGENTQITVYARWGEGFEPPEVQKIWDIVKAYWAGAW